MKRIDPDAYFMEIAKATALRSTCPRARVGAVLVSAGGDGISYGYNGSPKGMPHCEDVGCILSQERCIRTVHAEENALLKVSLSYKSTLYCTHRPCLHCSALIINARGIIRVVYGIQYVDQNCHLFGVQDQDEYLREAGINVVFLPYPPEFIP